MPASEKERGRFPLFYPEAPGYRDTDTSQAAAESMRASAHNLRLRCLQEVTRAQLTADEVAKRLGRDRLAVRPRMTELAAQGLIEDTGARRRNVSGRKAIVYRLADQH